MVFDRHVYNGEDVYREDIQPGNGLLTTTTLYTVGNKEQQYVVSYFLTNYINKNKNVDVKYSGYDAFQE